MERRRYGKKEERALGLRIKLLRASATFAKYERGHVESFGITAGQFAVLEFLSAYDEPTLGELTRMLFVSPGNMTVVVNNLVKEGLLEKFADAEDGRITRVRLSGKGKQFIEKTFPLHARYITNLLGVLSDTEQRQLGSLLRKLGTRMLSPELKKDKQ